MAENRTNMLRIDKVEWDAPEPTPPSTLKPDEAMVPPDPQPPAPSAPNFVYELVEGESTVIARGANLTAIYMRARRWIDEHME